MLLLLCLLVTSISHAGIDEVYEKKTNWWTKAYDELMNQFGIGKSYAIVIGVSQYNDKALTYLPSERDAFRIKEYLINEAGFDQVHLITGEKVTLDTIREYMLDYYPKKLLKNDRFLFYWSGHGLTAGRAGRKLGYLALKESSVNKFSTMISMTNITQWDRHIQAKQTLYLLDACFSGIAASRAMSIRKEQTIQRINRSSRQVFTAGLENQQTVVIDDLGGGVFTRALLDGLRGHADTDKGPFKKDGVVTIRELEEYVRERVDHERRRVRWNKPITPQLYSLSESAGDFFFVSDKRIIKPRLLLLSANSKIIATGVDVGRQNKKINAGRFLKIKESIKLYEDYKETEKFVVSYLAKLKSLKTIMKESDKSYTKNLSLYDRVFSQLANNYSILVNKLSKLNNLCKYGVICTEYDSVALSLNLKKLKKEMDIYDSYTW